MPPRRYGRLTSRGYSAAACPTRSAAAVSRTERDSRVVDYCDRVAPLFFSGGSIAIPRCGFNGVALVSDMEGRHHSLPAWPARWECIRACGAQLSPFSGMHPSRSLGEEPRPTAFELLLNPNRALSWTLAYACGLPDHAHLCGPSRSPTALTRPPSPHSPPSSQQLC